MLLYPEKIQRRIGGLETISDCNTIIFIVQRRIGGLESWWIDWLLKSRVQRRIGGLEKQFT